MKPTVRYKINKQEKIEVGFRAIVAPTDHPSDQVSNKKFVLTSLVLNRDIQKDTFETENTLYIGE